MSELRFRGIRPNVDMERNVFQKCGELLLFESLPENVFFYPREKKSKNDLTWLTVYVHSDISSVISVTSQIGGIIFHCVN